MASPTRDRLLGLRVLVVEDVDVLRHLIRCMLEVEGATVVEARIGLEAVELARRQTFDVALTDLGLPDMSGEAVVAGVRSISQGRTPVAVVTGAQGDTLTRAVEVGAERAFAKPVDWDDLIEYLAGKRPATAARNARVTRTETLMTVLIMEDDGAMRALLRDVLERAGYRVIDRPDGTDLADLAEHAHFDAVVLDKEMPGRNGLELLSFLRKRWPAVPVIVVTAFGGPGVAEEAVRRGAYSYLEKPFRMSAILDTLDAVPVLRRGGEPGPAA